MTRSVRASGSRRRYTVAAAAAAVILLLAGCATPAPQASGSPEPSTPPLVTPSVTPEPTDSATPSPTPTAVAGPLDLPACDDLIPLSLGQAHLGGATVALDSRGEPVDYMAGPAAAAAARDAEQATVCVWGIPYSDGYFVAVPAELTPAASADLIAALRGAGSFTEGTAGGGVSFSRVVDTELGLQSVTYAFDGPAWVTVTGSLTPSATDPLAGAALESIRAANS